MSRAIAYLVDRANDRAMARHLADVDEEMDMRDEAYDELVGLSSSQLYNECAEVASDKDFEDLVNHALAENGEACIAWGQKIWERMLNARVRDKREQERREHQAWLSERFADQERQ